jgi:predicted metal-binding protein
MFVCVIKTNLLDFAPKTVEWCKLPYPDHPHGCPAYGKRDDCPPQAKKFSSVFAPPFYIVAVRFDLQHHVQRMLSKHEDWTVRQARCVLYWQKSVDKQLTCECEKLLKSLPAGFNYTLKPEAMGVNVVTTCIKLGIPMETKPEDFVWKVAIIGKRG